MRLTYKKLWKILIDRKLKKADLQKMAGISSVSMAKLGKDEDVTTSTLRKVCNALHCSLSDIVETENEQPSKEVIENPSLASHGLTLGTVFSGIGAIEHALERMKLQHKIAFACDNGDIDILSKDVSNDVDEILTEFVCLQNLIQDISVSTKDDKEHRLSLEQELLHNRDKFEQVRIRLCFNELVTIEKNLLKVLCSVTQMTGIKKSRLTEYASFIKQIQNARGDAKKLNILKSALNVINDFAKDNPISLLDSENAIAQLNSKDCIQWDQVIQQLRLLYDSFEKANSKRIIKAMNDVSERLSMLHERITTFHITKKIATINSYFDRKKFIDSLYESRIGQNKVRESYLANYDISTNDYHWNVSFLDGNHYAGNVDLFVGGSPCQSFSLVGKQRGLEDTRGTLFYEYARLINEIRPKIFIYENVKAVLSNDEGRTWETMQRVFTDLHYNWKYQVLNAKDYGIPQNRERLFVVGFRDDLELSAPFEFPAPIPLTKSMQDFLLDNVSGQYYLPAKGVDFVTREKNLEKRFTQIDGEVQLCQKKNQQFNWHGDFVFVEEAKAKPELMQELEKYFLSEKVRKYVLATGTKGFYSRPQVDLKIARPLLTTMHKMHRAGVDNYVTSDGRLRKLTPRECLRLMGFCDSFKIVVSDTSMYQQSGNAIVVDVLIAILTQIRKSFPQIFIKEETNA